MTQLGVNIWYFFHKQKEKNVFNKLSVDELTMLTTAVSLAADNGMFGAEKSLEKVMRKSRLTKEEAAEICQTATSFMPAAAKHVVKRMKETNTPDAIKDPLKEGKNAVSKIASFYGL